MLVQLLETRWVIAKVLNGHGKEAENCNDVVDPPPALFGSVAQQSRYEISTLMAADLIVMLTNSRSNG